ncbi:hypothetical protein [Martelella soudanensis]|uniref:hypothetical protein n=1 Tax=unclassified Martelella TaxID=2629616 RepID=UPI0015DF4DEF|nr:MULTISPECIES: hypothetical protein [unclassified Martelella]
MTEWNDKDAALKLAKKLWDDGEQQLPAEILRIDSKTSAVVVDLEGVDYILTMMRLPDQRPRPIRN